MLLKVTALLGSLGALALLMNIANAQSAPQRSARHLYFDQTHEFLFAVTFTNSAEIRTLTVGIAAMRGKDVIDSLEDRPGLIGAGGGRRAGRVYRE